MVDKKNLNLVTTECGKQYVIDYLDQVALGILDSEEFKQNALFIPPTFSLYKTVSEEYLLEITHFNTKTNSLSTRYQLIAKSKADTYLANGGMNVLLP